MYVCEPGHCILFVPLPRGPLRAVTRIISCSHIFCIYLHRTHLSFYCEMFGNNWARFSFNIDILQLQYRFNCMSIYDRTKWDICLYCLAYVVNNIDKLCQFKVSLLVLYFITIFIASACTDSATNKYISHVNFDRGIIVSDDIWVHT